MDREKIRIDKYNAKIRDSQKKKKKKKKNIKKKKKRNMDTRGMTTTYPLQLVWTLSQGYHELLLPSSCPGPSSIYIGNKII
jgi:hypothetical protein